MLPEALTGPAATVATRLKERGETVSVAESSAGGLISAALLSVGGASAYYRGGAVYYTLESLQALLAGGSDLDPGRRGACEPLVRYLSASVRGKLNSDWGVGETGATGPSPNPYGDPPGHAWVSVAGPDGTIATQHVLTGDDDREANMVAFAASALGLLANALS
ncbi:MAG: nicotinamide-nucleotide amidase [Solirubrobacteraceae bacterium]|nr:nicotinamide-nucleotide amidase [Solirubrobacteraceae bacterium]